MLVKYSDVHRATHPLLCLFSKQQPNDDQLFPLIVNLYGKQNRQIHDGCSVNSVRRDGKQHSHTVHLPSTSLQFLHELCPSTTTFADTKDIEKTVFRNNRNATYETPLGEKTVVFHDAT